MDKVDYYYNNFHLLGIQEMQKNTISAILKRANYFNSIKDIEKRWIVRGNSMLSLSSNSCFEGMPMQGKVLSCWKDGIEIYQCN
ncbi:MAG: hypothetical protein CMN37_06410 [SAR116 cluster bacterium]|nr:hypothetical protein [SAR116 cluster bacterium]